MSPQSQNKQSLAIGLLSPTESILLRHSAVLSIMPAGKCKFLLGFPQCHSFETARRCCKVKQFGGCVQRCCPVHSFKPGLQLCVYLQATLHSFILVRIQSGLCRLRFLSEGPERAHWQGVELLTLRTKLGVVGRTDFLKRDEK